jgi:hypothetical protein
MILASDRDVGLHCLRVVFERHPESKGVFGMKDAHITTIMNDARVRRQAMVMQDTIGTNCLSDNAVHFLEMVIMDLSSARGGLRWPLVTLGEQHSRYAHTRGMSKDYLITFGMALLELVAQLPMATLNRWKRFSNINYHTFT